jgi:hypothetical protein
MGRGPLLGDLRLREQGVHRPGNLNPDAETLQAAVNFVQGALGTTRSLTQSMQ